MPFHRHWRQISRGRRPVRRLFIMCVESPFFPIRLQLEIAWSQKESYVTTSVECGSFLKKNVERMAVRTTRRDEDSIFHECGRDRNEPFRRHCRRECSSVARSQTRTRQPHHASRWVNPSSSSSFCSLWGCPEGRF